MNFMYKIFVNQNQVQIKVKLLNMIIIFKNHLKSNPNTYLFNNIFVFDISKTE